MTNVTCIFLNFLYNKEKTQERKKWLTIADGFQNMSASAARPSRKLRISILMCDIAKWSIQRENVRIARFISNVSTYLVK